MKIHFFQHVNFETPAMILDWAAEHGHSLSYTEFYRETPTIPHKDDYDFLIIMGGPMSANDTKKYEWLKHEKQHVKEAINSGKKILGICLGAQIIASCLGAKIYANAVKEIGWLPVTANTQHQLAYDETVFHWHGETFDLPNGALKLMSSQSCKNQAFLYGDKIVGLQFHIEMNNESISAIIDKCGEEITPSPTIQSAEQMIDGIKHIEPCRRRLYALLDYIAA